MKLSALSELFALPLQSATRAQMLAHQETMSAIENWGIEDGQVKVVRLRAERTVEERMVDANTLNPATKQTVQPFEISIPLLALLPVSTIQLQEMTVDFGVEVVEVKSEAIKSSAVPPKFLGNSLAKSLSLFTALGQTNPATMKVHMRITKETPEGIARMGDLLADLLCGQPVKRKGVEEIPGIKKEAVKVLKGLGVHTAADFLRATASAEAIAGVAKALDTTAAEVDKLRQESTRLLKTEGAA